MSIKLMAQVWDEATRLDGSELIVMLCLADHANDDGVCWPSTQRIADRCRVTKRHAIRLLARLERGGYIRTHKENGKATRYTLNVTGDIAMSPVQNVTGDIPAQTGDIQGIPTGDIQVQTGDIQGATGDIAMSPEPSIEPSLYDPPVLRTTIKTNGVADVFSCYETNIGPLTAYLSELIAQAVDDFGAVVVMDAIKTATTANVRKWAYVNGILERWRANGRSRPKGQPLHQPGEKFTVQFPGDVVEELTA